MFIQAKIKKSAALKSTADLNTNIDFKGKALERIKDVSELTPEVSVQHGRVKDIVVSKNPLTGGYRLVFDFQPKEDIAEIRAVLKKGRWNQTEVWSYQWLE